MAFSSELQSLAKKERSLIENQIQDKLEKIDQIRQTCDEKIAGLEQEIQSLEAELGRIDFVISGKVPRGAKGRKGKGKKRSAAAQNFTGDWKAAKVNGKPTILFKTVDGKWATKAGKRSAEMNAALKKIS